MKKFFAVIGILFFSIYSTFAGIKFENGDINKNDEILFTVQQDIPGTFKYSTLVKTSVQNLSETELFTSFPEQMELLDGGKILQLRNRYGISHIDLKTGRFQWRFQKKNIPVVSSRLSSCAVSPDGKWMCYFQKTGWATGFLILEDTKTGKRKTIDSKAHFNYDTVPVKWSEDSSIFVYEKGDSVYFCSPEGFLKGFEVSENFRKIGSGSINSVNFAGGKYLIYIDGDLIYRIGVKEMYTTGLYSQIIGKGKALGRLPAVFDSKRDIFSCNDFLSEIFVIQNGKFFNYYKINSPLCEYLDVEFSGPFISSDSTLLDAQVFWSDSSKPIVWVRSLPYSGEKIVSKAFSVSKELKEVISLEDSGFPYLSPNSQKIAFFSGDKVFVYDTVNWKKLREISGEKIVSIIWQDDNTLILGGEKTIRSWNIYSNVFNTVFLSSCDNGYFLDGKIFAEFNDGMTFVFDDENKLWITKTDAKNHENQMNNGRYRIFCGTTPNSDFENAVYVRTLSGKPVTTAVYADSVKRKSNPQEVALVFDAYDSAEGLSRILYELDKYKVTGTFFLNGEFIRRYPNETRQIANSKNDSASMFFTSSDLFGKEFVINEEFIRRGLARNEDEFFACTKKEISLFWHAPYYQANSAIKEFGAKAGYTYISPKLKDFDNVTLEQALFENKKYVSTADLIDEIMNVLKVSGGGIVPVTVGISKGSRVDYLYDYLPLLLSAILDEGYKVIPVKYLQQ